MIVLVSLIVLLRGFPCFHDFSYGASLHPYSLTLGAHAPEGLRYLSCLFVCLSVRLLPLNRGHRSFLRST